MTPSQPNPNPDTVDRKAPTGDYFPFLNLYDKVDAYKKAIIQSLDLAVHPEHLKRAKVELSRLEQFWGDAIKSGKEKES